MKSELLVILLFFSSIFFYFAFLKVYDLDKEIRQLNKEILNRKFKICYNKGVMKGIRKGVTLLQESKP